MLELEVLRDVIEKLDIIDVEYMLTGSLAMNFYAEPRMTRDIDIVIDFYPADLKNWSISSKRNITSQKTQLQKA